MSELDQLLALLSDDDDENQPRDTRLSDGCIQSIQPSLSTGVDSAAAAVQSRKDSETLSSSIVDPCLASKHCPIRVCNEFERKLSQSELDSRLQCWTVLSMRKVIRMSGGDSIKRGQFAMIAVVARKTLRESAKGSTYLRIHLSDLQNHEMSALVFDESVMTLFSKITEGSVIALAGAPLMEDRSQSKSSPYNHHKSNMHAPTMVTLRISKPSQVLVIGFSKDFGYCRKVKQNMERCREVVNLSQREYCAFHSRMIYERAAQRRNDANQRTVRTVGQSRSNDLRRKMLRMGVTSMTKPMGGTNNSSNSGVRIGLSRSKTQSQGATAHFPCSMLSRSDSLSTIDNQSSKRMTLGKRMMLRSRQDELDRQMRDKEKRNSVKKTKKKSDRRSVLGDITLQRKNTAPVLGRGLSSNSDSCSSFSSQITLNNPGRTQLRSSHVTRSKTSIMTGKVCKQKLLACDRKIVNREREIQSAAAILNSSMRERKKKKKRSLNVSESTDIGTMDLDSSSNKENTLVLQSHTDRNDQINDDDDDGTNEQPKRRKLTEVIEMNPDKKEEILNTKSLNPESNLEWMDYLSFKESESERLSQVNSVQIRVYVCTLSSCPGFGHRREFPNAFCKNNHPHLIAKKDGRKYFFQCEKCKSKQHSIDRKSLRTKCIKCGESRFKSCSAYRIWEPKCDDQPRLMITNNRSELSTSMLQIK